MQISVDSNRMRNGKPPQILGATGYPRYNEFSIITDFFLTGFHCTFIFFIWLNSNTCTFIVHVPLFFIVWLNSYTCTIIICVPLFFFVRLNSDTCTFIVHVPLLYVYLYCTCTFIVRVPLFFFVWLNSNTCTVIVHVLYCSSFG